MTSPVYLHLKPGDVPSQLHNVALFKAILVIEAAVSAEWREAISNWLVQSGCLYLMAWGQDCEAWHDCVDDANLSEFDFGEIPDDRFVMTTWHTKDRLNDVFWFSEHLAMHPTLALENTYIIHIALSERSAKLRKIFRDAIAE